MNSEKLKGLQLKVDRAYENNLGLPVGTLAVARAKALRRGQILCTLDDTKFFEELMSAARILRGIN